MRSLDPRNGVHAPGVGLEYREEIGMGRTGFVSGKENDGGVMKKVALLGAIIMAATATMAFAGVFDTVKSFISTELISVLVSAGLGILYAKSEVRYGRVSRTLTEAGVFLEKLGTYVADGKTTREEIADLIKQGALVVDATKVTPPAFKVAK